MNYMTRIIDDLKNPLVLVLKLVSLAVLVAGSVWLGASLAAWMAKGYRVPLDLSSIWAALTHPGDPSAAWGVPMPGAALVWTITAVVLGGCIALWRRDHGKQHEDR